MDYDDNSSPPPPDGEVALQLVHLSSEAGLLRLAEESGVLNRKSFKPPAAAVAAVTAQGTTNKRRQSVTARDEPSSEENRPASKKSKPATSSVSAALTEKGTGLRHFSMQVCKKVEEKGQTTHNEVADELVQEIMEERQRAGVDMNYDEKNIRRRVYDAINVLMAMDIISKHRKEIRWRGLPSAAAHEREQLQRERAQLQKRVRWKQQHLKESLTQLLCIQQLADENTRSAASAVSLSADTKIQVPFIVISTAADTIVQCEMTEDRQDVYFELNGPFEINDDTETMKRLQLHKATAPEIQHYIPPHLVAELPEDIRAHANIVFRPREPEPSLL